MEILTQLDLQRHRAGHDLRRHRLRLPAHLRHLRHPELRPGRRADAGRAGRPDAGRPRRQLLADDPAGAACSARSRARWSSASACGPAIKIKSRVRLDHVDHRARHHLQERGRERLGPRRPASSPRRCPSRRSSSSAPTCCRWRSWWSSARVADDAGGRDLQPQVDLRQGGGRHLQRPRRRQADGHQHRPGDHLLVRAVVDDARPSPAC